MMRRAFISVFGLMAVFVTPSAPAADTKGMASHRRDLQLQHQQDALSLSIRQGLVGRRQDFTPSDARRLDQLQMQQRMEQQLLEQQQAHRDFQLRQEAAQLPPHVRQHRIDRERQTFATERELQMQQFDLEQRQLMQSMPRAPLQPPVGNPQLDLR